MSTNGMKIKTFKGLVKSVDSENFTVKAVISDETIDRYKEVILASAWAKQLGTYKKHPVLLSSHGYGSLQAQIGELSDVKVNKADKSLEATIKYYVGEGNAEADWGFKLAEKGIAAFSVGFLPHEAVTKWDKSDEGWKEFLEENGLSTKKRINAVFTEVELLENSQVVVPANPSALQKSMALGDSVIEGVAKSISETFEDVIKAIEEENKVSKKEIKDEKKEVETDEKKDVTTDEKKEVETDEKKEVETPEKKEIETDEKKEVETEKKEEEDDAVVVKTADELVADIMSSVKSLIDTAVDAIKKGIEEGTEKKEVKEEVKEEKTEEKSKESYVDDIMNMTKDLKL